MDQRLRALVISGQMSAAQDGSEENPKAGNDVARDYSKRKVQMTLSTIETEGAPCGGLHHGRRCIG